MSGRSSSATWSSLVWFFVLLFISTGSGALSFRLRKVMIPSSSPSYSLAEEHFRLYIHLATRMLSFDAPARWACLSGKLWIHPAACCATEQSSSIRSGI